MGLVGAELLVNFIRREGLVRRLVWVQRGRHDLVPQRSTPLSSGESWGEHLLQEVLSVCRQTSKPVAGPLRPEGLLFAPFSFPLLHRYCVHSTTLNSGFFEHRAIHMRLLRFRACSIP